jgi:hypothetical protein
MYRRSGRKRLPTSKVIKVSGGVVASATKKARQQHSDIPANFPTSEPTCRTSQSTLASTERITTPTFTILALTENLNTDTRTTVTSPTIVQSSDVIDPVNDLNLSFNNTGNGLPVEIVKASVSIARNIGQYIKQKISMGEYVDLGSLLNNPQNNTGANQTFTINQGQLVLK